MSELVITAAGFVIQPLVDQRNGPCEIRWWYSRSFLTSDNVQINYGTGTTGFWITTPCSIADGLITVDQDTELWCTDDAQDPAPQSIFLSAGIYSSRGKLIQQLQISSKAQWVVPSSLAPTTTWADFSAYNLAVFLANPPSIFYTAPQIDALLDRAFDQHPALDTDLGTVLLTIPADIPASPVVWGANDPLVRDAVAIQGVDVSDTVPLDSQILVYNQANNQYEPANQAAGAGNVTSNEVSSVDGNVTLASGTGGKTIKFDSSAHFDGNGLLTGATVDTPATGTEIANKDYVDSAIGGLGAILADGSIPFAADESMGGFKLTNVADPEDDTDAANKEFVLASVAAAVQQTPNISALVSGGGVFWVDDYDFQVAAATYLIQGDLFTSTGDTVTLDPADPTLDRIDVIALDDTGSVVVITGTAASQPSQPDVDPGTQLLLTFVLVTANTTQPVGVSNTDIYLDNAEWTATTSGSGWNVNSTTNPFSGTKCIEGTNVANAAYVQLQALAPLTLDTYAILSVFISPKAAWPKKRSLVFQWFSAGVALGVPVTINTGFFGFDSANATYQLLAIPIAQFAIPAATSLNQLRITDQGGAIGMFVDNVVLQANGSSIGPPIASGITQAQADARYLQQANNLSDVASASTARTNIGAQAGPLTGDVTTSGAAATLANTAVTPGSYTNTNLTVDAKGRITAAANGAAGPGSSIPTTVQGDTLYASAPDTLSALAKDTNATRYLSNTGASNNPAWAQVALSTGISGFGTGVAAALATNVGSAGAPVVNGGALGTPSSGTLSACTGLPVSSGITGLGTGVAAALAVNIGSAGAFVAFNGALGTPSSGTLSSCSGLPISTGVSGLGSNVATFLATPSSANLAAAVTDETGSGLLVFATSPVFSTDITLPNSSSPTTGSVAKVAFDTDAWAASRGAVQVHDGTANTYLVGVLASDTPSNGQVPTWNTGGTVTWETPSSGGTFNSTTGATPYLSATNVFSDSPLFREDADTLAQRHGTTNQTFLVYQSFTSSTNYSRLRLYGDGTSIGLLSEKGSGGGSFQHVILGNTSNGYWRIRGDNGQLEPSGNNNINLATSGSGSITSGGNVQAAQTSAFLFSSEARLKAGGNGYSISIIDSGGTNAGTIVMGFRDYTASSGSTNNPDFGTGAFGVRVSPNAAGSTLTGCRDVTVSGELHRLYNVSTALLTLANQNTGSTAGNRWLSNTGMDINLAADEVALYQNDGSTARQRVGKFQTFDTAVVTTQFDKTSDVTLANITMDRTFNVSASRTYEFEAILYTSSNIAGGVQFAIAGTATATAIVYEAVVFSAATLAAETRATALGTAVGGITAVTAAYVRITGMITVNAAGTLTVQFAQNASNGTASSVLVGSIFRVNKIR